MGRHGVNRLVKAQIVSVAHAEIARQELMAAIADTLAEQAPRGVPAIPRRAQHKRGQASAVPSTIRVRQAETPPATPATTTFGVVRNVLAVVGLAAVSYAAVGDASLFGV
jgi:hypothetical protein